MSQIEFLQNLFLLFPFDGCADPDFPRLERLLQKNLGVRGAFFVLRTKDGLRTPGGKKVFTSRDQKKIIRHLNRVPHPWMDPSKGQLPWLGFWPVMVGGEWAGVYVLGKKLNSNKLNSEGAKLMELLADRTGWFLEQQRLRDGLERVERESSLGFLSAAMIHEIRNPLAALSTLAQLLPKKKNDSNFMESYEKLMLRETDRLTELTENFLGFLKPAQGKTSGVDFSGVVHQTIELLKPLLAAKGVRLRLDSPLGLFLVGDEQQIRSLVLNLTKNALESAKVGGLVQISNRLRKDSARGTDGGIELKVKNDGKRIAREDMGKIFIPYFSLKEKGFGLGLAICKRIVENHQGVIQVTSSTSGTQFRIFLPCNPKNRFNY